MSVNLTTYTGLKAATLAWMARSGDTLLDSRFDDLLALHEQRMYYGADEVPGMLPQFKGIRIREMEVTDSAFAVGETVAQPSGFLELIEAYTNSPVGPLRIEHDGVMAAYGSQVLGGTGIITVSGTNLRFKDATSGTVTLRYYKKLTTPAASAANWILENAPGVYQWGCLIEAALMTQDFESAMKYGALYAANVGGLNARRNRELAGATNVRTRNRGRTP